MKRSLICGLVVGLLLAGRVTCQQPAPTTGKVTGIVLNETGDPVAGAMVHAEVMDGRNRPGFVRWVEADRNGLFTIDHLEWGPYEVYARKQEAGYADQSHRVYQPSTVPAATLSADHPSADLTVFVGPKAGLLIASITDAVTGRHVDAVITIWKWRDENTFMGGNGDPVDQTMIPANTDVGYQVTADGYYPWNYSDNDPTGASAGTPLRMEPGEKKKVVVKLRPIPK